MFFMTSPEDRIFGALSTLPCARRQTALWCRNGKGGDV